MVRDRDRLLRHASFRARTNPCRGSRPPPATNASAAGGCSRKWGRTAAHPDAVPALHRRGGVGAGVQAGGMNRPNFMPLGVIAGLVVLVADQVSKWWVLQCAGPAGAAPDRAAAGAEPDHGVESRGDVRPAERPWQPGGMCSWRRSRWRSSSRWGSGCAGRRSRWWRWRSGRSPAGRLATSSIGVRYGAVVDFIHAHVKGHGAILVRVQRGRRRDRLRGRGADPGYHNCRSGGKERDHVPT